MFIQIKARSRALGLNRFLKGLVYHLGIYRHKDFAFECGQMQKGVRYYYLPVSV